MSEIQPPVCDYEGSDYQESFWEQGSRDYEDRVEAIALQRLLPTSGKRLLEIGAGAGRNTLRYHGFDQIVLLDYSRTQLEQARDRLGLGDRYIYVVGDVYRLPFRLNVFDGATMIRTIHHLVEPEKALEKICEGLAPGAALILEFANKRNLKAIGRWLLKRQLWNPFTPEQIEFAELNFNFHPRSIGAMLRKSGFDVIKTLTVSHFRMDFLKRIVPLPLLVAVDSMLQWTGALWQFTPSVFLRAVVLGEPVAVEDDGIFCCPECGGETFRDDSRGLLCQACGCLWTFRDGIFDFKEPVKGS